MAALPKAYRRNVFVNCPFDKQYKPMLDAILFAIHDCGFVARTALEEKGSATTRLDKIARIIRESQWSIHDISRVRTSGANPLPRFNMPFECGLAMGLQRFGTVQDRRRDVLILEAKEYRDKQTLSDLAGQDFEYHGDKPGRAIEKVRAFLANKVTTPVRGADSINKRYGRFRRDLPRLVKPLSISPSEIVAFDFLNDLLTLMVQWQKLHREQN